MKVRNRLVLVLLILAIFVNAGLTQAETNQTPLFQQSQSPKRDSIWNGILIGAGIGAVAGC